MTNTTPVATAVTDTASAASTSVSVTSSGLPVNNEIVNSHTNAPPASVIWPTGSLASATATAGISCLPSWTTAPGVTPMIQWPHQLYAPNNKNVPRVSMPVYFAHGAPTQPILGNPMGNMLFAPVPNMNSWNPSMWNSIGPNVYCYPNMGTIAQPMTANQRNQEHLTPSVSANIETSKIQPAMQLSNVSPPNSNKRKRPSIDSENTNNGYKQRAIETNDDDDHSSIEEVPAYSPIKSRPRLRRPGSRAKKHPWTESEDELLIELAKQRPKLTWVQIASHVAGRTAKQCRERHYHHLQPDRAKHSWTVAEDKYVFEMQKKIGNRWAQIARELPGRTDAQIKNRFYSALRRQARAAARRKHKGSNLSEQSDLYSESHNLSPVSSKSHLNHSDSRSCLDETVSDASLESEEKKQTADKSDPQREQQCSTSDTGENE